MSVYLYKKEVEDEFSRDNFLTLESYIRDEPFRKGKFRFIEVTVNSAVTNFGFVHKLGFLPLDVIPLSVKGLDTSVVTWHYDDFSDKLIYFSTTGPCTIRAYVGRYRES